ncbi:IgGFc-binding protein-like isoform X2 [Pelodiscus sinensis]|uniref:IgGFc-binding protein-like isoform X2 n=1 Tax=Pelodiscus sinensis TaxID=13735 RepID=UPI003F6B0FFE
MGAEAMEFANAILRFWAWIFVLWSASDIFITVSSIDIPDSSCSGPQGTEFITVFMQNHLSTYGSKDFRLFITGYTSGTSVTISVNKADVSINVQANPGETTWVQIPEFVGLDGSQVSDHTVIIRSDHEISILSLNYKTYTADTTVVYPVQRLGTEYYVVTPMGNREDLGKQFAVVAWKDPTVVEVYLKGAVTFQGETYRAGRKLVISLRAYQAVQLQSQDDLSGTRIVSANPMAVYSGHVCVLKHTACDYVSEQLLPVSGWGTTFIVPPLSFQPKFDLVYVAASQHTHMDYRAGNMKATRDLVAGQVVPFEIKFPNPLYISASAGIQVVFFCTGGKKGAISYDPFLLTIPDVSGYCQIYHIHGQELFQNYAVIVAKTAETAGVTVDEKQLRAPTWRPIPGIAYSWTEYDLGSGFTNHVIENPHSLFSVLSVGIKDKAGYGSSAIGGILRAAPTIQPADLPPASCSGPQGTEFITVFMQNHLPYYGGKNFKLFITGYVPGTIVTISVNKADFLVTVTAHPEDTVSVMIPAFVDLAGSQVSDHTVIIRSDHEISILSLNYKSYTADTTVVYPVQRLGTEYYVVTPMGNREDLGKQFAVVAWKDPTVVEVYLKGAVTFQGETYRAGRKLVISLRAYQAVQLQSQDDLSGTRIVSANPVAVYSGHVCVLKHTACDYVSEQLLPVSGWGTTFIVPPLSFQPKFDLVYVAASQHTHMDYRAGNMKATRDLVAGQVVPFEIKFPNPLYISASAGIQVVFFCTGGKKGAISYDPFLLTIPDVSGYCQIYHIHGQDKYENYALITAKTSESGGITTDKKPLGNLVWKPIPGTEFSWAQYSLGKGFKRETIEHPRSPFGLLSIGIASKTAYGSPAIGASNIPKPSCSVVRCKEGTICKMIDGQPECVPVFQATCWAGGYLYYHTFDGRRYDIQGTCTYTVAKTCGCDCDPHSFDITVESWSSGNTQISFIGSVTVQVDGVTVRVARAEVGYVRVNNTRAHLPISLNNGVFRLYQSGTFLVLRTSFNLSIAYDWKNHLRVTVPRDFSDNLCGLCSNDNKDSSDDSWGSAEDKDPSVLLQEQTSEVEDEKQHCWHDCIGGCRPCAASIARKYKEEDSCGLITKVSDGPFSQCHAKVDPTAYLDDCVYDLCHNGGYRKILCEALKAYADACQLEGVRIGKWRQLARCSLECPLENSQYQLCGTACPATCVDHSAPSNCQDPCVESCQCKDGFVLSQGKCIPKSGCGCLFEGRPYAPNESFWLDEACGTRCICNADSRQVECVPDSCKRLETCGLVYGIRGCYPSRYATCSVARNLHYTTFDGQRYNFQGTCRYQLTALCKKAEGLVDFEVYFQENNTTPLQIRISETDLRVSTQFPGKIMVDGLLMNLPFYLEDKKITAYRKGWATVIQTDFGLSVTFTGWSGRTTVTLPVTYAGAVCGLCGNFNRDREDDLLMRDGTLAPNPGSFGQSWKVGDVPGCSAVTIPPCANLEAIEQQQRLSRGQCGLILYRAGPFRGCHRKVDPHGYFIDCVYGYCFLSGRESNVCQAIAGYAEACQEAGAVVYSWRTPKFCFASCPQNSHYEFCSRSCDLTCSNLYAPVQCTTQCKEGCVCDEGFVLSGDRCVPVSQCGCLHRGLYYQVGETFHPSGSCEEQCICQAGGEVVCKAFTCGTGEQCGVVDGVRKCHPFGSATCSASGHPHYLSFDGVPFDFQGTCTYILAKTCTDSSNLTPFTIRIEKESWGSGNVSVAKQVSIQVYGITLTLLQNRQGLIMVDGVFHNLPMIMANRQLQAYQHGTNILVQTDFGLTVSYDLVYQARVTIPQRYRGHTCGLCGNYRGRQDSKFLLPSGKAAPDVAAFGSAWEVQVPGESCIDRCAGNSCPVCEEKKKDVFKQRHYCGLLTDPNGPFAACHGTVSPSVYFNNCLYDVCLANGDSPVLCQSIHSYVTACQEAGASIQPWRSASFCPMSCPANSHYQVCADLCSTSCAGNITDCPESCAEGCQCDNGFLFDGQGCVPQGSCGCIEQGRYYKPSEMVLTNECQQSCTCVPAQGLTCKVHRCGSGKTCQIRHGVMDCIGEGPPKPPCSVVLCEKGAICKMIDGQPECVPVSQATCSTRGYLHYHTFDGRAYDFHGACNYVVAKTCRSDSVQASFHVTAKSENSGNTQVFYIVSVNIQVYGVTIRARRAEMGFVWVNNTRAHLPISLDNGALQLYQSGTSLVLRTSFKLRVSYDWNNHLRVTVPRDFSNSLCGLCGNYNGDPTDDFQTPDGDLAPSVAALGRSWAVEDEEQHCWHDCIGGCKPCAASIARKYKEEDSCGLITKVSDGPFSQCHAKVDPRAYLDNCVYDLCHTDGYRKALCEALKAYADDCQLEGVRIGDWRQLARCSLECPLENSQYQLCGTACPATCVDHLASSSCQDPCVESCQCKDGFVLSQGKCIPKSGCGCLSEGRPYAPNESFWLDEACGTRCKCNADSRQVECQAAACKHSETCGLVHGVRGCYPSSYGTCSMTSSRHYTTFDGERYTFQGTCRYQLTALCKKAEGLVDFEVYFQDSNIAPVQIKVSETDLRVSTQFPGKIMVNNFLISLPSTLEDKKITTYRKGWATVIQTDFGLSVTFTGWSGRTTVTLPVTYAGAVCGLCGNFNRDREDDFQMRDGTLAPNLGSFGQSWKVGDVPGCSAVTIPPCANLEAIEQQQRGSRGQCGLILYKGGPFRGCHRKVDPHGYFIDCVYGYCFLSGQESNVCQAIAGYAEACQEAGGVVYPWRTPKFCSASCPQNSHYEFCSSSCDLTCSNLYAPVQCTTQCKEGCVCDEGFVLSGDRCVPISQCGCLHRGLYYQAGETFHQSGSCEEQCMCQAGGEVVCKAFTCGTGEQCGVVDGVRKCHPFGSATCSASGHPHYLSFDGVPFDFQGTCTYILAKTCTDASHLTPFTIRIEKESWGSGNVSVAKQVSIQVYGITLTLLQNRQGLIMVNRVAHNLPVIMADGQLKAYQHGTNIFVQTEFGLTVSFDLVYQAKVSIPGSYEGQTCGLCGNYNGREDEEFLLPDGSTAPDVAAFGSAWEVQVPGAPCTDRCAGNSCPVCEERKKEVFKASNYCGLLTDPNGPFATCHGTISPSMYLNNCLHDVCLGNGDSPVLCQSIHSYVTACQEARIFIKPWRSASFCPMSCPVNSHYELCADLCTSSCTGDIMNCLKTCAEGCQCDDGFLFDGQGCVPQESCGCFEHGKYYKPNETVLTNECQQSCTCVPVQGVTCKAHQCAREETCQIRDGVRACASKDLPKPSCTVVRCKKGTVCKMIDGQPECVPVSQAMCWAGGYLHYHTFDGRVYNFHGTCNYTVAKICRGDSITPFFHVTAKSESWGNTQVSYIVSVTIQVDRVTITAARAEAGFVWVNNTRAHLPISLNNGVLRLYQSGTSLVLRTSFKLSVAYDWNNHLRVTVPRDFSNSLCGLCGNYNGDPTDDFQTPDGDLAPSVAALGRSWAVEDEEQHCWHDCIGGCKPCAASIARKYKEEDSCGLITKVSDGPFSQCHAKVDPTAYLDNCVYDLCHTDGYRKVLCEALKAYADACQLEGVRIGDWRQLARCSLECPLENSQYQLCGIACPATCVDHSAPSSCQDPCVESCQCKDGFVLSQGKCIPKSGCGCLSEGRPYAPNESFWLDEACGTRCKCNADSRQVECQAAACKHSETCGLVHGVRGCYPSSYGTCSMTSSRHYTTFDGERYTFQGTCRYQLTALCKKAEGLVDFEVHFQENNTTPLQIRVYQTSLRVSDQFPGKVLVDSFLMNLPFYLEDKKITAYRKGWATVIQTDFGLSVTFTGWSGRTTVTLPVTYAGAVCGLCGNFNRDRDDDLLMRDGTLAPNPGSFGQSWKVGDVPECSAVTIPPCANLDAIEQKQRLSRGQCGLILQKSGPFRGCHHKVEPHGYFLDCVYDYCFLSGRESNVCQAIAGYAEACQEAGAVVYPWRTPKFCPASCPQNSHYEFCSSSCDLTCSNLYAPVKCTTQCKEGCMCDDGFVLSGDHCVPLSQCGCLHRGLYYQSWNIFHPSSSCEEQCVCQAGGEVVCKAFTCGAGEQCGLVDGVRKCHPFGSVTCSASGHPHYLSFDGVPFDFQGTCTYILARTCTDASHLTPFTIRIEKESWGSGNMSVAKQVSIQVYGITLTLLQNRQGLIMVDGVSHNLPVIMGQWRAYQHGSNVLVQTDFGLTMSYNLVYQARVTIPGSYRGQTCGLCGNYNGREDEEFLLPNGSTAPDVAAFGSAWEVPIPGASCVDRCAGNSCPVCEERKKEVFKGSNYCGLLSDPDSPFAACHGTVSPSVYLNNCIFDVCLANGHTEILCQRIHSYVTACQEARVFIQPWRNSSFCPMSCPNNSHYELCADLCTSSCTGDIMGCPETCAEGCQCDDGFFFDGQGCVPQESCGCFKEGRYYKPSEVVLTNECQQSCTCVPARGLTCKVHRCGSRETCQIRDGVMGCMGKEPPISPCSVVVCREGAICKMINGQPECVPVSQGTCWARGYLHYHTFDGRAYDFHGNCTYTVAKTCKGDSVLPSFRITAKSENSGSTQVFYIGSVTIQVDGVTITAARAEISLVWVNNTRAHLPISLNNGVLRLYQSGTSLVLRTSFKLSVAYDWNNHLRVTVPRDFSNSLCGLCGNYNGDPTDDFQTPDGDLAPSVAALGRSWAVEDEEQHCWHDCIGGCKPCAASIARKYKEEDSCGLITKVSDGPFSQCHAKVDPTAYLDNCVYDLCHTDGYRKALCEALKAYADACQLEGVRLGDWRQLARCPLECPLENSQYQLCGTACPATCVDHLAPSSCQDPCVESCQCKDGFVLSQGKCIPKSGCGCLFEGRPYAPNESFWLDEACGTLCKCNADSRQVECQAAVCKHSETCGLVHGVRGCYPSSYATCSMTSSRHYTTFDGETYTFQGTCRYQLTALCKKAEGLVDFEVHFQENNTTPLQIRMYQTSLRVSDQFPGKVLVDSFLMNLPFYLGDKKITAYRKGWATVIQTDFGLSVTFTGWSGRTTVTLPVTYAGAVCGLCGNFNRDRDDDLLMRDGTLAPNPGSLGQSWKVGDVPGCSAVTIPPCANLEAIEEQQRGSRGQCGLILDTGGPFRGCHRNMDPHGYFLDCVYDYCFLSGRESNVCQAIAGYAEACQEAGAVVYSWRTPKFCPASCTLNSHYEFCRSSCDLTCSNLYAPVQCTTQCKEGCVCDEGFVLSGDRCVPISQCGCLHRGLYYEVGETFHPSDSCEEQCMCQAWGEVVCKAFTCGTGEQCGVVDGVRKCHPFGSATCSASGHPHYLSFDGVPFDFQGTCTYILAKTCTDSSNLMPFTIRIEKESWGSGNVSVAKQVSIQVYGITLTLLQNRQGLIMVDGVSHNLPLVVAEGQLQAYQHGGNVLVQTDFGLTVSYDLVYQARVTVPGNYQGQTCGLCGNYNGRRDDEFLLPGGKPAPNVAAFGLAWKVPVPGAACEDGCSGNSCPVCEERKKDVFKQRHYCGVLTAPDGPFAACHGTVSPSVYFNNCLYDVCLANGDSPVLCQSIHSYVTACQEAGASIQPWRSTSFCPMTCPANSYYEVCASLCSSACARNNINCPETCAEGCQCDAGFLFDGQGCVPQDSCGCFEYGRYYKPSETILMSECQQSCTCLPAQDVTCKAHHCASGETCRIRDGIMGCMSQDACTSLKCRTKETCLTEDGHTACVPDYKSVCLGSGATQYQTFDGLKFDFQGTCTYTLAKYCGSDPTLEPFAIEEKNDNRGSQDISFLRVTNIYIYGHKISIYKREVGKVRLNGVSTSLPVTLKDGKIRLYQKGLSTIIQTDVGLQVGYSKNWQLTITLPSSYYDAMCGLCGNFNKNPEDDMLLSSGTAASSIVAWAPSWKVQDRDPFCWDFCQETCPMCEESKRNLYGDDSHCGLISKALGPFRECHSRESPDKVFDNCLYDVCQNGGEKTILCVALEDYADKCKDHGATVYDWRTSSGCNESGENCEALKCGTKETCKTKDGHATCVPDYLGTCWSWGDPHYQTFDGLKFDFQGSCTYTVAKYCGHDPALEPFAVDEKNDNRGSQAISILRVTNIYVYGYNISIYKREVGKVRLNGMITSLPVTLADGKIRMYQSGLRAILQTDFGLQVAYNWDWHLVITVPSSYYGATCGLCGNFNQNPDDDLTSPNGTRVSSTVAWAAGWKVQDQDALCWDSCQENCLTCDESTKELYRSDSRCRLISQAAGGPFRDCHSRVNPSEFFNSCVADGCLNKGATRILCQALEAYAATCTAYGITLDDWRTPSGCALPCPENSHYEACGDACPASCSDRTANTSCREPCVETCQCNAGYVLSAGQCVPVGSCGCDYNGRYYQPSEEFWADENCRSRCRCDPSLGMVLCQETSCKASERCAVVNGVRGCQPISYSTCIGTGDPHYTTFDGKKYDFMGTCIYQFAALCSQDPTLTPFNVKVENNNRGSKAVSFTKTVTLEVYNVTISLSQEHPRKIQVDGVFVDLPFSQKNKFKAYISGVHGFIKTDFDLRVSFDWYSYARVIIPSSYAGAVCGLCGNANQDPSDDLTMKDGTRTADEVQFADSWKVGEVPGCSASCTGDCSVCSEAQRQTYRGEQYCGVLARGDGPFSQCHGAVDPTPYFDDCAFDTCQYKGHHDFLCSAISAYVMACQARGIPTGQWRSASFCKPTCPLNSHYELCGTSCPTTCHSTWALHRCEEPCAEGCFCDTGFTLSGDQCVPVAQCGCVHQDRYYQKEEEFYPSTSCRERCLCKGNGVIECREASCGVNEECGVKNGVLGCHTVGYGTCLVSGGNHYTAFDGWALDFQGSCTYTLAKVCRSDSGLGNFSVVVENEGAGGGHVVVMKTVVVSVHDYTITMERGRKWKVLVGGELYTLPLATNDGKLWINQEGNNIILQSAAGLGVFYDAATYLRVSIPSTYKGHVCGLCGNFNDDKNDDLLLPGVKNTQNVDEFVSSWKVPIEGALCSDGCGEKCPTCDVAQTAPYQAESSCGLIKAASGPFRDCHSLVSPAEYFSQCLHDMCTTNGTGETLCQSLQAYAAACQATGARIKTWRTASFCPLACPANSHYELCTRSCDFTCASLFAPVRCTGKCFEGCLCDPEYVSDGGVCVSMDKCGCVHNGRYIKAGESFVSSGCSEICTCQASGEVVCEESQCTQEEECMVRNGMRSCVQQMGRCTLAPGAWFTSFDGVTRKVLLDGAYELTSLCEGTNLPWFRMVVIVFRGDDLATPEGIYVFFDEGLIHINKKKEVWVRGHQKQFPVMLSKTLSVSESQGTIMIVQGSRIKILFSLSGEVTVTVSQSLANELCAPCGNFNGDDSDDLRLPSGQVVGNITEVFEAWKARDLPRSV